jgi:hypothetical protein
LHPLYITFVAAAPLIAVVAVAVVRVAVGVPSSVVTSVDVNISVAVYGFIAIVTFSNVLELFCCCYYCVVAVDVSIA